MNEIIIEEVQSVNLSGHGNFDLRITELDRQCIVSFRKSGCHEGKLLWFKNVDQAKRLIDRFAGKQLQWRPVDEDADLEESNVIGTLDVNLSDRAFVR